MIHSVLYFNLGGLGALFVGLIPPKPPVATGLVPLWSAHFFEALTGMLNFFFNINVSCLYHHHPLMECVSNIKSFSELCEV